MRSAIVRTLKENPDVVVVGECVSYAQTLELAATLKPDVVLLDLLMPDERDFSGEEIKLTPDSMSRFYRNACRFHTCLSS